MYMDNSQNCILKIKSNYKNFSNKEKLIADFVLESPHEVIHSTISQLSEVLKVAKSTIFRFCQQIGFQGFQAMKISLAAEIVSPMRSIHENVSENDSTSTITKKSFNSKIKTIEDTLQLQDEETIKKVVRAILESRKIQFYGVGGSAVVAWDAYHKFVRSGLLVNVDLDAHMQLMSASQMGQNDLAILISHSGSTKDVLDLIPVLKENQTRIVAITNFAKSPLTEESELSLYTVAEETNLLSDTLSSRVAQLSIIDALYTNVMISGKDFTLESLQKTRNNISKKRL